MTIWKTVPRGDKTPRQFNVIIEIPKDSMNKYEVDKETGMLTLARVLYSAVHYPGNYGFIPQTMWYDGDPLDVLVLGTTSIHPLTIVESRPIGVLKIVDNCEEDDKIIAVPVNDPRFENMKDIKNLAGLRIREIEHFFTIYKELQGGQVQVLEIRGKKDAEAVINQSIRLFESQGEIDPVKVKGCKVPRRKIAAKP